MNARVTLKHDDERSTTILDRFELISVEIARSSELAMTNRAYIIRIGGGSLVVQRGYIAGEGELLRVPL